EQGVAVLDAEAVALAADERSRGGDVDGAAQRVLRRLPGGSAGRGDDLAAEWDAVVEAGDAGLGLVQPQLQCLGGDGGQFQGEFAGWCGGGAVRGGDGDVVAVADRLVSGRD